MSARTRKRPALVIAPPRRRARYARKKVFSVAAVALLSLALVLADRLGVFGEAPPDDFAAYHGKSFAVVRVVDGDTLDIDIRDRQWNHTRIRLWGVDTPETLKPDAPVDHFGPEASRFTRRMALDQVVTIELESRTRDKYGRLLAYVILPDGQMLNRAIIEHGYGYADPRFGHTHKADFARLQKQAMSEGRGLWQDVTQDQLPYYYRESLRLPQPST